MTIQSCEGIAKTTQGAIDRQISYVALEKFKNIRCNIQEKSQLIVSDQFSLVGEAHIDIIYHQNYDLYKYLPNNQQNQTVFRIITNMEPSRPLAFPFSENQIYIFKFMGHIEQIKTMGPMKRFYILRCQRNNRQVI